MGWFKDDKKFDRNKLQPNLKMSVNRLNLVKNKKVGEIRNERKNVGNLLAGGQDVSARHVGALVRTTDPLHAPVTPACRRIRVESLIRMMMELQAYEILTHYAGILSCPWCPTHCPTATPARPGGENPFGDLVLRFTAFFKEGVSESPEAFRVRKCVLQYYL
eukprot:gene6109-5962_t